MAHRICSLVVVLFAVALPAPAVAQVGGGGTLVYIDADGQIAMFDPSTDQAFSVTSGGAWEHPSMAADGTIVAVDASEAGSTTMVRMTQAGEVLSTVTAAVQSVAGIVDAEVSPDGTLIAFETFRNSSDGASSFSHEVWIIPSDGSTSEPNAVVGGPDLPTWYPDGSQVVVTGISTFRPNSGDSEGTGTPWFDAGTLSNVAGLTVSADEELIATSGSYEVPDGSFFPPTERGVRFWSLDGPPPAEPTELPCRVLEQPEVAFGQIALAPDGSAMALEEGEAQLTLLSGLDTDACTWTESAIAGASQPHWSTGTIGGSGEGPPGPGPGPGGPLPDGVLRLDGGGQADPVAQAIFVSQQLFDDGAATRVVLATADRFPDALAGTALAGGDGPILFTSGGGDLDPRVAEEISRVTGGGAPVLVLGGTAAVSEAAAVSARAAGGDTPCAAPLPPTCRFAGSGREETATLVADTVLAENPEAAGLAIVARGDEFADAITGGAFAAAAGIPILLTPTDLAHPFTVQWLEDNPTDLALALGGTAALADATLEALPATRVARVAGAERTATSAVIATDLWQANGGGTGGVAIVNVRAPNGWQTALSAAVASALFDIPQLGVEGPPATLTQPVLDYLADVPTSTSVVGFGDPNLVSDEQLLQAADARR